MEKGPADDRIATLQETVGELQTPEYLADLLRARLASEGYAPGLVQVAGGLLLLIRAAGS
jgi:hypothetical protein